MKSFILAMIIPALGVMADERLLSCGHSLVNRGEWGQSDIAEAACGRADTCNGQEWNTLFEVVRMSSGPASWAELKTTGVFCHKGCWEEVRFNGQCH